jgi:uncharacterized protein YjdB
MLRSSPLRSLLLPGLAVAFALACGVVPLQETSPDSGIQTGQDAGPDGGTDGGAKLVSLAVTPPTASALIGTHATFVATATFSNGTNQNVTDAASWTSSASSVATVAQGVASALTGGTATITATYQTLSAKATLTVPTATIVSIAITPLTATTNVGATTTFDAVATLSSGSTQDFTTSATWTSSNPSAATVAAGVATGVAAGTSNITAQVGAVVSGPASLTVDGSPLVSLAVTPTNPTVAFGTTLQLTATGTYGDGTVGNVTATASWASSNTAALTVAAGGLATAVAAGTSTATASVGSISGSTTVTVSSAPLTSITVTPTATTLIVGGTVQLDATGTFGDGTTADVTGSAVWSASSASASVSNAQGSEGLATALASGTATITAAVGAVSGTATITVTATTATLLSIAVTPATAQAGVGTTQAFQAEGSYSDGTQVDLTSSVTWSSSQTGVATISKSSPMYGVATAVAAGSTSIQATLSGITGTATLTVTTASLLSITVTPANPAMTVGDKQAMTATGNYSDGSTADLTQQAVWTSSNTAVATLSNDVGAAGLLTAVAAGTATITATVGSLSGSTTVTVNAPTPVSLTVSPITASIALGQNQTFAATLIYSNNTSMNVTRMATWASSNTGVATITNGGGGMGGGPGGGGGGGPPGQATSVGAGTSSITATYMGLTGTATLTVTAAVPVSITVSPVNPTLPTGVSYPFTATAILSDGTSQSVTAQATWTSSDTTVAGVSTAGGGPGGFGGGGGGGAPGVVTTITGGSTVISATYQGLTGTSTVTVTSATVVSITVSPASDTLIVGDTVQYSASAIFSDGQSGDVTAAATWSSTVTTVAGVTDAAGLGGGKGLATAIAAGTTQIQATYQGVTGSATLTVSSATLSQILVSPTNPSVSAGTPVTFGAQALFSDGTSQDVTAQATWSSSAATVAQVGDAAGNKGVATTLTAGTATITATWDSVSGSAVLTVTAATLSSISVTPFSPTLHVGYAESFVATGIYSDNSTQDLTRLATWTSTAAAVASVGDTAAQKGYVDPLTAGTATIQAAYQGVTGTDAVTVSAATLASIAVTPGTATVSVGQNQQFDAMGTFSDSSMFDVTTYVTWLSSNSSVAPISNAAGSQGQATGIASGTAVTITAIQGAVSGTASITVQ